MSVTDTEFHVFQLYSILTLFFQGHKNTGLKQVNFFPGHPNLESNVFQYFVFDNSSNTVSYWARRHIRVFPVLFVHSPACSEPPPGIHISPLEENSLHILSEKSSAGITLIFVYPLF